MADRSRSRLAPFSLRLTREERALLESRAGGQKLGSFIKTRILAPTPAEETSPAPDKRSLARWLGNLGQSDLARNVAELSRLARLEALHVTPETETALRQAAADIAAMKSMLMRALRIKED